LTIKFTQSTSAASGRMLNFRTQACAWLRLLTINCQRNSMTYAPVHRGSLIRGFRDKAASPSQSFRAVKRSRLLTRLHYGPHTNRRLRILIKILTLRLCSYINLFSCQISRPAFAAWAAMG
jgi:hypothetical protein